MAFRGGQITRMLRPESIAILGASARRPGAGNDALANLVEERFPGALHLVHPAAAAVDALPTVPTIDDLPEGIDVALVALPAPKVVGVLEELEARGCNAAVVPSTGFAAHADEFRAFADRSRMIVHGPNNMGFINLVDRVSLWIQRGGTTRETAGNVGLVAQSGSAAIFMPRTARPGLFSRIVSSGSEWQLTAADYVHWLAADEATEAIGLVLESIRDPQRFREAVAAARRVGKPIAVLKVGRTEAGQRATTAHTGALVAGDDFYRTLFDELDLPMVDDYDELASVLEMYASPRTRSAPGSRVGATTLSGGQSALLADLAASRGVEMAPLTPESRQRLDALIPGGSSAVPVDLGGGTVEGVPYDEVLRVLLDDETVDTVMVVCDAQDTLSLTELEVERLSWVGARKVFDESAKPIVFASSSARSVHRSFADEVTFDAPILRGFGPALVAAKAISMNRRPLDRAATPGRPAWAPARHELDEIRGELAGCRGAVPRALLLRLLGAYGIGAPGSVLVRPGERAAGAVHGLSYPLVAKVASSAIPHRTEAGCVIMGIAGPEDLEIAVAAILERAAALVGADRVDGVEIQEQLDRTLEASVGAIGSEVHGPMVVVGAGGVLVELLDDAAKAYAPVDRDQAIALIGRTRLRRLLAGYRRIVPPTDERPLADLVQRVSLLVADLAGLIAEVDLNPVLIEPGSGRASVVDALVVTATSPPPAGSRP